MEDDRKLVPEALLDVDPPGHQSFQGCIILCDSTRQLLLFDLPVGFPLVAYDVELLLLGIDRFA